MTLKVVVALWIHFGGSSRNVDDGDYDIDDIIIRRLLDVGLLST